MSLQVLGIVHTVAACELFANAGADQTGRGGDSVMTVGTDGGFRTLSIVSCATPFPVIFATLGNILPGGATHDRFDTTLGTSFSWPLSRERPLSRVRSAERGPAATPMVFLFVPILFDILCPETALGWGVLWGVSKRSGAQ